MEKDSHTQGTPAMTREQAMDYLEWLLKREGQAGLEEAISALREPEAGELDGSEGYPDDKELERIATWPVNGTPDLRALFDFVRGLWNWRDWGWKEEADKLDISTGGWSGNEDIIDALEKNFIFWSLCWVQSRRGGHYQFELREIGEAPPDPQRPAEASEALPSNCEGEDCTKCSGEYCEQHPHGGCDCDVIDRHMTPEEADAAYDAAPSIPISEEEAERLVELVTAPDAEERMNAMHEQLLKDRELKKLLREIAPAPRGETGARLDFLE